MLPRRHWMLGTGALLLAPRLQARRADVAQLFGGPVRLHTLPGTPNGPRQAAMRALGRIHRDWNAWKPGEVQTLNSAFREGRSIAVSPALRRVLAGAREMEHRTAGRFNAAAGGLYSAWGFHADRLGPGAPPADDALATWLEPAPSLAAVVSDGTRLRSRDPRVQVDLGGYAKGVALDTVLDDLQRQGIGNALLDLGGNLAARGNAGGRPWRVGLRDPFTSDGLMALLDLDDREAVITSGTYERWRNVDGQRLGHVIDPARGRPVQNLVSATVVHPEAALADAAATALLVA
ncbi:MAG: FAD:protein FMN transferase, partial [Rhodoferax sp.]|nr:FAD:protein FMN transferase [Rhodoferax sp.]